MAKTTPTTIVEVWNKTIVPALESGDLSATEQAVLVHIAIALNRNLWSPMKINAKLIAAATDKDRRTVTSAINHIAELGIITNDSGVINFGKQYNSYIRDNQAKNNVTAADLIRAGQNDGPDTSRKSRNGDDVSDRTQPSKKRRQIFNRT